MSYAVESLRPYPYVDWVDFLFLIIQCIWFLVLCYIVYKEARGMYVLYINLNTLRLIICLLVRGAFCYLGQLDPYVPSLWLNVNSVANCVHCTLFIGQMITIIWPKKWLSDSASQYHWSEAWHCTTFDFNPRIQLRSSIFSSVFSSLLQFISSSK